MNYSTRNLRNIGIIGHSGSGKTSLVEALLYFTHIVSRLGTIEGENTISDYDIEEKKRKISISTTIEPCEWKGTKINLIDIPGYFDFIGEIVPVMCDSSIKRIGIENILEGILQSFSWPEEIKQIK